jgi:2-polyprenyl-6-methoxyphenol hydroxylase-like FAD-dependent oxidoreductase
MSASTAASVSVVLVHGGFVDGSGWQGVYDSLRQHGYFIIGGDGAGSVVRKAMHQQLQGFTVATRSHPNYCTMIELDRVGDDMDPHYLHGLSVRPFCVAGAIKPDRGSERPRWFCAVGTKAKQTFSSPDEARRFFRTRAPRVQELTSDEKVAAVAERTCYHIGQMLACSQLHGGKAVLLGDAAAAFPPIEKSLRESRPDVPRIYHVATWYQRVRSGEKRRSLIFRGPS